MTRDALAALPLPLRALGVEIESDACTYAEQSNYAMGERLVVPLVRDHLFLAQFALLDLGGLLINSGRISPMISRQGLNHNAVLLMNYGGGCSYRHGFTNLDSQVGDVLLTINDGGAYHCDHCSGICLTIDTARLQQSTNDLLDGSDSQRVPALIRFKKRDSFVLLNFFAHVDHLLLEERWLPKALGLGGQLYRYLAVALIQQSGQIDQLRRRHQEGRRWSPGLDELVDHIRSNRQEPGPIKGLSHPAPSPVPDWFLLEASRT